MLEKEESMKLSDGCDISFQLINPQAEERNDLDYQRGGNIY